LGLTQFRIKRLYAYSTISHVGFILLALSIQSIESVQAFFFYIMQYSISNLNAFILLIMIGYYFFSFVSKDNEKGKEFELKDTNNSPIQLISQIKGFSNLNPILALSLGITLFSFIGVPPLIGFFGKQMILSAALDKGYVFITLVAILTSVISAVYYLAVIKNIFFEEDNQKVNPRIKDIGVIIKIEDKIEKFTLNSNNIILSSSLTSIASIITLIILLFMFISKE
jgi:NADH-ubiquinone oxidoreductase chain 2